MLRRVIVLGGRFVRGTECGRRCGHARGHGDSEHRDADVLDRWWAAAERDDTAGELSPSPS